MTFLCQHVAGCSALPTPSEYPGCISLIEQEETKAMRPVGLPMSDCRINAQDLLLQREFSQLMVLHTPSPPLYTRGPGDSDLAGPPQYHC